MPARDESLVDYEDIKDSQDSRYRKGWENAPPSFKRAAAALGLEPDVEGNANIGVMEYDEGKSSVQSPGHTPSFYIPSMEDTIDTHVDRLIEKYGVQHKAMIMDIAADLQVPMQREIECNRALMLGRVAMYLVKSETNNIMARVHALLHAIPRLAAINGFGSMRESARACGVSCEWIRRVRNLWCEHLQIPVPEEGTKSIAAKQKYAHNANHNHWRDQVVPQPKLTTPCPNKTKQLPRPRLKLRPQLVAA